jgi:N-acylneuraminate cytidylyltransferase/CMP-N,N'-diacetyllegionaminic acid synthase
MINGKRVLGLVPAREGSKGLKDKNVIDFLGRPLMAWSIDAGVKSKYVDRIIVSTDSKSYAEVAKNYGAEVPFIRPKTLAEDNTSSIDMIFHTLSQLKNDLIKDYELLVLLEPTSPLRTYEDVDLALETLMRKDKAKSLVSVGLVHSQHPEFQFSISEEGYLHKREAINKFKHVRRQDLIDSFFLDGSIYISYVDHLKKSHSFISEGTLGYLMPKWKTVEIDDEYDFEMAVALAKRFLT